MCYNIVYYYYGAQWYEQFLQVGRLYQALILLGLAVCLLSTSVSSVFMALYVFSILLNSPLCILVSRAWWDWPLTWLTNRSPSVVRHFWLGHLTYEIVLEMTCSVSSGMLNALAYTYTAV